MPQSNEGRPLPEVIGGLFSDISTLFRKEIDLAKAETSEKIGQAVGGLELLIAGAVLALGALGVLLAALVGAISALLQNFGMDQTASNSLAALLVGAVVGVAAYILISRGLTQLKPNKLNLNRTVNSLARDAELVKERL